MDFNLINVAAAFIVQDGKVLVAKRNDTGKWEFPGGKMNEDEKTETALVREINEELGVTVKAVEEMGSVEYHDGADIYIIMFIVSSCDNIGGIKLSAHSEYKFCSYNELFELDLAEPDKNFIIDFEEEIKKKIS